MNDRACGPNMQLAPWIKPSWLPKVELVPAPEGLEGCCWLWHGAQTPDGYGRAKFDGIVQYLHRRAWEHAHGEELGPERDGHHRCYRRNCFNAAHIQAQSRIENRGSSYFQKSCALSPMELLALFDLYGFYKAGGYALTVEESAPALGA